MQIIHLLGWNLCLCDLIFGYSFVPLQNIGLLNTRIYYIIFLIINSVINCTQCCRTHPELYLNIVIV